MSARQKTRRGRRTTLLEQVAHPRSLEAAFNEIRKSRGAPGVDRISLQAFGAELGRHLEALSRELRGGWYVPLPVRRCFVPKSDGGRRAIGIQAVRDRVVARACQRVLTPRIEPRLCRNSFAYRKGRSCRGAINRVMGYVKGGARFVTLLDIADFFPTVDRALLQVFLGELLNDDPLVPLLGGMIAAPAVDSGKRLDADRGIEQGSPLSPLLANVYLHPWDAALTARKALWVRYSDNALIACRDLEDADRELRLAAEDLDRLKLKLNRRKSEVRNARDGFPFLGYQLSTGGVGPELVASRRLGERLRDLAGEDPGRDPDERVKARRRVLQGWLNYYSTLQGVPMRDVWTLVAGLELAAKRGDRAGAGDMLRQEMPEMPEGPPGEAALQRVRRLAEELSLSGLGEIREHAPCHDGEMPSSGGETRAFPPESVVVSPSTPHTDRASRDGTEPGAGPSDAQDLASRADWLASRGRYREAEALTAASGVEGLPAPANAGARSGGVSLEASTAPVGARQPPESRPAPGDWPTTDPRAPNIQVTRAALALLHRRFKGAVDRHARMQVDRVGRRRYYPVPTPLDEAAWRRHLGGQQTLALVLHDARRLHVGVIDVDIAEPGFGRIKQDPDGLARALALTHAHVVRLAEAAQKRGLAGLVEDSGQKGRHLWLFFEPAAAPRDVFQLMRRLQDDAGPPPNGIHCESIPASSRAPASGGALVTLPLGVHLQSGRRSVLMDWEGRVQGNLEAMLAGLRPAGPDALVRALEAPVGNLEPELPIAEGSDEVRAVLGGCGVMAQLVRKAGQIHHLAHMERMALLCVMAHLGQGGEAFVHRVMQRCANYDRRLTQKYIGKVKPSPVSCRRIREWLPEVARQVGCSCDFELPRGGYPTPALLAVDELSG